MKSPLNALASLAAMVGGFRSGSTVPAAGPFAAAPAPAVATPAVPSRVGWVRGRLRRSLVSSVFEGMTAEVVNATAGGAVLTAWALHLHASALVLGIVAALPFWSSWAQFPAAWLTSRTGSRRLAIVTVALSRQVLWPLVALPFLPLANTSKEAVLLAVSGASALLAVIGNNAWTSWMGELVPSSIQGRYFGRRTAMCTLAGAVGSLGAGAVLDFTRARGSENLGLSLLALIAGLSGTLSFFLMRRQHDPGRGPAAPFTWSTLLRPFGHRAARRLIAFLGSWNVAIGLSSAFFIVFELQDLRLAFTTLALLGIVTATLRILAAPFWGRAIDRFGARPVVVVCSALVTMIPLVWLFPTPARLWPVGVDAVLTGILWSGHNLATFQLPLSLAPREGRPFFLAAFSAAAGIPFAVAAAVGGLIAGGLPRHFLVLGHPFANFQALFALSFGLRLFAVALALRLTEPGARSITELGRYLARSAHLQPAPDSASPSSASAAPMPRAPGNRRKQA